MKYFKSVIAPRSVTLPNLSSYFLTLYVKKNYFLKTCVFPKQVLRDANCINKHSKIIFVF